MKKFYLCLLIFCFIFCSCDSNTQLNLKPKTKPKKDVIEEAGTGWSQKKDPKLAAKEAVKMALKTTSGKVKFAIIFASAASKLETIVKESKKILGKQVKILAMTSDSRGVICEKKYVRAEKKRYKITPDGNRSVVVMTCSSPDIEIGLGHAKFVSEDTIEKDAEMALKNAIKDAGKKPHQKPKAVLVGVWNTKWRKIQNALNSIGKVIGENTPLIGQCPGGPQIMICNEHVIKPRGIVFAVFYTDLPVGVSLQAGFETRDLPSGIVTKVSTSGNIIEKINNENALEVYKKWMKKGDVKIIDEDTCILQPLYFKLSPTVHDPFHPHPIPLLPLGEADENIKQQLLAGKKIKVGEKIYLSQGNWQTLLNRVAYTSEHAKLDAGMKSQEKPLLSIFIVCCGVLGVIPDSNRDQIPVLINKANSNAPFIASIAWGEHSLCRGFGYRTGNLHIGCLVIGRKKKK